MKNETFRRGVSCPVLLPLLFLVASLSAKATEGFVLSKPHGELQGLWGAPSWSADTGWLGFNAGGGYR